MIHDAHTYGHHAHAREEAGSEGIPVRDRLFAMALHRLRLDERIDAAVSPILSLSGRLSVLERRVRGVLSIGVRE